MASGRYHPDKNGRSEPRRQSNWQRSVSSDYDDVQSLNSLGSDIRINNWDFSDLRPSSLSGNSKHHKKSKGNPEREREQSLSADSPPHDKKTHTPSSYPRTKITPDTPTSQRVALENLKQHMTFSDVDDLEQQGNMDGDRRTRNNERQISKSRRRVQNSDLQADSRGARDTHRNNNTDFLNSKQGQKRAEDLEEVHRLIRSLQEQEQGIRGLLHKSLDHHVGDEAMKDEDDSILQAEGKDDSNDDDDGSVDLEVQSQDSENSETTDSRPRIESKLGIDSDKEVDNSRLTNRSLTENSYSPLVASHETAENTGDTAAATDGEASSEYRQELLHILRDKQQQLQSLMVQQDQLNFKRREMEKKLVAAKARDNTVSSYIAALNVGRQVLEHDQPTQRSSQRPTGWEVNENGTTERGAVGESRQLKSNIVGYPESDDEEDNSKVRVVENLPTDLLDLRRQLNYLKNEHSRVSGSSKNMEAEAVPPLAEGYEQLQNKLHQLQSKKHHMDMLLQEFQKLQAQPFSSVVNNKTNSQASNIQTTISSATSIPESQHRQSDNGVTSRSSDHSGFHPSSQTRANETTEINPRPFESFVPRLGQTSSEAPSAHTNLVLEMREKLRCLREVRAQLDQLSSGSVLRQDESKQATASPGNKTAAASPPSQQPHPDHPQIQQQKLHMKETQQAPKERSHVQQQQQQGAKPWATSSSSLRSMAQLLNLAGSGQGEDEHSDEDNASVFQSELQWSHLGPCNDDPEIQEKVRKLKSAKEKLQQLQDLVALVQQSPDTAGTGPEANMGDLTTGDTALLPDQAGAGPTFPADDGHLRSESDDVQHRDSELDDIQDPRAELVRLRKEKAMLLEIQNQLRHIQNQATSSAERREDEGNNKQNSDVGKAGLTPTPTTTVVTFASNDELYSKIRRQRILHEELRSRKRELEAFMTKDRNKKQYSRNQDNQSDVSLNTDAYGNAVSVDATMATWGGSTVDNLENITEDFDRQERCGNQENEGYQSDGINEMEEEEEEEEEQGDTDQGNYPTVRSAGQRTGSSSNLDPHLTRPGDRQTYPQGDRQTYPQGDRQTYPQPSYSERYVKLSKTRVKDRMSPSRQDSQPRSEPQEYRQGDGDGFERKHSEWFRAIESQLSGLGSAVDVLLRRSETEGRQLHLSLSHESALHNGGLMSPMQDQMLQLQNQSLMLSFGQLVQSVSRQQGDIQQLQQQVQALNLQMQSLHLERSFHSGPLTGSSAVHAAQAHPAINSSSSNYSLHAAGAVATHDLTLNRQHVSAPFIQNNQSNSLENFPVNGLGLQNFVGRSTQDLHHGMDRRPGSTASSGSVPTLRSITSPKETVASFNANETRQSGSRLQQNLVSRDTVSIPAATIDDARFIDHQQPAVSRHGNSYSDVRRFGAVPHQRNSAGSFHRHFLKEKMNKKPGSEDSTQESGSILLDKNKNKKRMADGAASNGGTTFNTLRDTIYTEAASLISQNENRPHFLLELFRDMRQIDSDLKRHRALYSVQEVLRLTPNAFKASPFSVPSWSQVAADGTNSGHNSSESAVSEDDDAHIKLNRLQEEIITLERGRLERQARNAPFDYAETADNMSSLSTPTDGGDELPFFKDTLGETVLDFDSLKKAGDERQQLFNKIFNHNVDDNGTWRGQRYLASDHGTVNVGRSGVKGERRDKSKMNQMASGIAVDQANEFLEPGMAYPHIDMKQLDGQIKDIMMKTIPLVKEHMEDVCSVQLLNYIRCLVISLTSQIGSQDFVRFFQHQLASVLEETLQKFEGRKMKDCGEDLLVGVSDVLYNELAFFRLMENLDSGNKRSSPIEMQVSEDGSISDVTATSGTSGDFDEDEKTGRDNNVDSQAAAVTEHRTAEYKQEQMRMHQDRTINKADIQDHEERDEPEHPPYKIELAPSETKPFTRIGSDEDDDEGDEEWSLNDPSETAVSRDSMLETSSRLQLAAPPGATPGSEVSHEEEGAEKQDLESEKREQEKPSSPLINATLETENPGNIDGELATGDRPAVPNLAPAPEVNNDHPTEVQHRYEDEQASLSGLDAILASLGGMEELAGDESSVLDPDSFRM